MLHAIKAVSCAAALLAAGAAFGQGAENWPNKPVIIVVPFSQGASTDIEGKVYMAEVSKNLGQQFLFDFRPGGVMTVGLAYASKQKPDGYTLMMTGPAYALVPLINIERSFDPVKDFDPVSLISKRAALWLVSNNMPFKNVKEYIAYAKANPGKINVATGGQGGPQHLTGAWLESLTDTKLNFIHYKSIGLAYPDLMAGRTDMTFATFASGLPMVKAGKVRAIAVASLKRNALLPDLPTGEEQGLPGFEYSSWLSLWTVAKTPAPIVNKLHDEIAKVTKMPEIKEKMGPEVDMLVLSPADTRKYVSNETERWRKLTAEKGIKLGEN